MKKSVIIPGLCFAALSTIAFEKTVLAAEPPSVLTSQNVVKSVNVDAGSTLNVRSKPSTNASIIMKLVKGTNVTVLSESKGWSKIQANGKTGYVSSKYLAVNTRKPSSVSKPTTNPPKKPSSAKTVTKYVEVDAGSSLNMRNKAATNGTIIAKLAKGAKVTVLSESNGWSKIQANGKTGYVSSKYLAVNTRKPSSISKPTTNPPKKPSSAKTVTKYVEVDAGSSLNMRNKAATNGTIIAKLAKGAKVTVLSESNGWSKIQANGKTGYVSSKFLTDKKVQSKPKEKTPAKTVTKYVDVDTDSTLNMRSKASTSGSIVAKLKKGTKVTVQSESNGWSKITASGKTGYVSSKYLTDKNTQSKPTKNPPKQTTPTKTVTKYVEVDAGSTLNMRNKASTSGSIVAKLKKGIEVTVLSESNGWSKIKVYDQIGYVKSELLSATKPISNNNDQGNQNGGVATGTIMYVNVDAGTNLNMRSSASTNGTIIAKLTRGTAVTFLSESNGWAKITANGKTGYVSAKFLTTKLQNANKDSKTTYSEYNLTLDEMVKIQMAANPQTDNKYRTYIREDALKLNSSSKPTVGVVQGSGWNVRGGAGTNFWSVGQVSKGTSLTILSSKKGSDGYTWYEVKYNKTWVNASPDDIKYYLDPSNFVNDPIKSLQFINLSKTTNVQAAEVNDRILAGKGILSGKASAFITAGNTYGINELYLISHALLETGNGKSTLANGVKVNGKTVYNMYGIGAFDSDPVKAGANFAYNAGWFTPEQAIIGGAEFIAKGYINAGQNTLYKMRWNPDAASSSRKATHQYATDIGWAVKQIAQIHNLYSLVSSYSLIFDIPVYRIL
ncbi:SH3 domain-containing protein [Bacillus sporothermodurans]|uniref:SH3 domain-containing protein n=1 Tax=Heyndrickxia sporothermodurans TaxID=46224 RepID=UPI00192B4130|nr:SH3 domain-containing protein [Heyndrickxia sporothermodurans]MBL5771541.1 SH3 domain-containing protein [Heyndrickxia sporothermodurans]MBL5775242.1 SH3 domain-containing protein [Heyndrickxia sporothermodurans]MBL5785844.1 SH3 domain-containing protein [Heyndrickxia sporothermodurans]MBL5789352.1 SH3 domain-containing protein [Heyndrickxia sporothermodurans]MBL5811047.1 SH3 domain-containing protein [Heyndrickxia sporothermodurans]